MDCSFEGISNQLSQRRYHIQKELSLDLSVEGCNSLKSPLRPCLHLRTWLDTLELSNNGNLI